MNNQTAASQFGAKAHLYEKNAQTQVVIAKELARHLTLAKSSLEGHWLDIGSGPAIMAPLLYEQNPQMDITLLDVSEITLSEAHKKYPQYKTICADMDNLPHLSDLYDGIIASSSFQWSKDMNELFKAVHSLLTIGSISAFALFTDQTLTELRNTQDHFGLESPVHFPTEERLLQIITEAGFTIVHKSSQTFSESYSSGKDALRAISTIGAAHHNSKKLSPRRVVQFVSYLEQLYSSDVITNNYSVSFFIVEASTI